MNIENLLRKLKTVAIRPAASARVAGYHVSQWLGRRRLVGSGLREIVQRVEAKCAASGALPPNYMELWLLYSDVRRREPRAIFEFGSGLSTNIMAAALRDNAAAGGQPGKIHSFESEKSWFDATDQWLDIALQPFVNLVYAPVSIELRFGRKVFRHANVPRDVVPDMVYLDGPHLTSEVRAAADLLDMEAALRPGFWLVIDGRRDNAEFLRDHFSRSYQRVTRSGFMGGGYMQRCFELQA